jgi:hypothetical protein
MRIALTKWLAMGALLLAARPAAAVEPLNSRLPEDALGFIEVDPTVGGLNAGGSGTGGLMDVGFEALRAVGVLPRDVSVAGDALGLAAMSGNRHFCIGWLDADLTPGPHDGLMCKSFQLVWLVDTRGRPDEMLRRITALLDHVSTRETSRQNVKKAADNGREFVEFTDTRWPAWLKLGWTQEKDVFVLGFGAGAMEHYLADRPVGGVPWAETVTGVDAGAAKAGSSGEVFARIYASPKAFRERFPEAIQRTLLGRIFQALELSDADKALFSARRKGRVVSMDFGVVRNGTITATPWTVPLPANSPLLKVVPPGATSYLALDVDWPGLYARMTALLDAILTDEGEPPVDAKVKKFATHHGVDLDKDVLSKAEHIVLVHDFPQHPLGIPLMVTAIASADGGGAAAGAIARKDLDKLLADAQRALDKRPGGVFRLRTDKDGVMYMQFGLVGPAWGWTGNRLVWSWSPAAVRENLSAVAGAPAGAFGGPPNSSQAKPVK